MSEHATHGRASPEESPSLTFCPCLGGGEQSVCAAAGCGYCANRERFGWVGEPTTFCTLIPDAVLESGESYENAIVRLFAVTAEKDEHTEILPIEDPRFVDAVDITHGNLLSTCPADKPLPELVDRARGVFLIGGVHHHLRVTFVRRKQ